MRKTSNKTQTEGQSTEYLACTPQNCQGHQKQGASQKLSQPSGASGDIKLNITQSSGWDPETEKGH